MRATGSKVDLYAGCGVPRPWYVRLVLCWDGQRALVSMLAICLALVSAGVRAQDATPVPVIPPPSACTVPPRPYEEMAALLATPAAAIMPTPTPGPVPEGTPADPATAAAIIGTVTELVACYNTGETLRIYSMYTDAFLQRLLLRQGTLSRPAYDALATPVPPDNATAILAISGVRFLDDGKAGAMVTLHFPSIPVPKTFFYTFAREGNRWLVDDVLGEITFSVP